MHAVLSFIKIEMSKRACVATSLVTRLPAELSLVVLRMVGEVPLSERGTAVDRATVMWLRGQIVLVPRVLYVVTPVHTWYADGRKRRSVFRVRRMQRYGAQLGRMISRIGMEDVCDHWCDRRPPARTVGVYYAERDVMVVPWVNGKVDSRPRGCSPPPDVL